MTSRTALDVAGLGKTWDDGKRRIDILVERLTVRPGEIKAIVGPSGSGKSTALDLLALVRRPDQIGRFCLPEAGAGTLTDLTDQVRAGREDRLCEIRRQHFAYVVQTSELIPFLRVAEDFELQRLISGTGSAELAQDLARQLDIGDCLREFPSALSVGQRQRAAVVRAAAAQPRILLADEPTSALDPDLKTQVIKVFETIAEQGAAIVMVTHDVELIRQHNIETVNVETHRTDGGWKTVFSDQAA